jgi:DNA repair protein SbcD/Mre11
LKLLHAADLHIDSPLRGLEKYPDAPVDTIRTATRRAMENLVAIALNEQVDAVLLAGDIYDGDWRGYDTGLFFQRQLGLLADAEIPVYLVSGNHDAESQISRNLSLPHNVHKFTTHQAESVLDDKLGLAVHGQGYVRREMTENLAADYPRAVTGMFNVGLLHTALTGREGHANYAPCTVEQLVSRDYGYWALGHVHTREIVAAEPHIVFPGNIQGRHARETGPKGCTLVTVQQSGQVQVEHRDLDVVRWAHLEVDASTADDLDEVCELVRGQLADARDAAAGRLLAARVSVTGSSAAHAEVWRERERLIHEIRTIAFDLGEVWVEKVRPATQPADTSVGSGWDDGADVIDGLLRTAKDLGADPDALRRMIEKDPLWAKLPQDARGTDRLDTAEPEWCAQVLGEASDLLVSLLQEGTR